MDKQELEGLEYIVDRLGEIGGKAEWTKILITAVISALGSATLAVVTGGLLVSHNVTRLNEKVYYIEQQIAKGSLPESRIAIETMKGQIERFNARLTTLERKRASIR